jgi:hypothetical protein
MRPTTSGSSRTTTANFRKTTLAKSTEYWLLIASSSVRSLSLKQVFSSHSVFIEIIYFYGTRRFISVFTKAIDWNLSDLKLVHTPYPVPLRCILKLNSQYISNPLFPSYFPIKYCIMHFPHLQFVLRVSPTTSRLTL